MTVNTKFYKNNKNKGKSHAEICVFFVCCLPSLIELADAFEGPPGKSLSEIISALLEGSNLEDFNVAQLHSIPEVVPLDMIVLRAIGDALSRCQQECSIVVFKHSCIYSGSNVGVKSNWYNEFHQDAANWQDDTNGLTECRVFTLLC